MRYVILLLIFTSGCSIFFQVSTDQISYDVNITGYGIPTNSTQFAFYGEGSVCLENLPDGITLDSATVNGQIVNNSSSTMDFELMVSKTGYTECGKDTIYYEYKTPFEEFTDKPPYIDSADVIFSGSISPSDTILFNVSSPSLKEAIEQGRIWIIIKNVSYLGISGFSPTDHLSITFDVSVSGRMDASPLSNLNRILF